MTRNRKAASAEFAAARIGRREAPRPSGFSPVFRPKNGLRERLRDGSLRLVEPLSSAVRAPLLFERRRGWCRGRRLRGRLPHRPRPGRSALLAHLARLLRALGDLLLTNESGLLLRRRRDDLARSAHDDVARGDCRDELRVPFVSTCRAMTTLPGATFRSIRRPLP